MKRVFIILFISALAFSCSKTEDNPVRQPDTPSSELALPAIISDNMVLQQDSKVNIWGKAIPGSEITIQENILIGEVWLCSGQSNMEMPMRGFGVGTDNYQPVLNSEEELSTADFPSFRYFKVPYADLDAASSGQQFDIRDGNGSTCGPPGISTTQATRTLTVRHTKAWKYQTAKPSSPSATRTGFHANTTISRTSR